MEDHEVVQYLANVLVVVRIIPSFDHNLRRFGCYFFLICQDSNETASSTEYEDDQSARIIHR